jgi:hypothetical protein
MALGVQVGGATHENDEAVGPTSNLGDQFGKPDLCLRCLG